MSDTEIAKGLNCPRCGGVVPIPDGQLIVRCPSCDFRSIVQGDVGVRRYQVPVRSGRDHALRALDQFFGNWAIALDIRSKAKVSEVFMAHLPFWTLWGRALGWAFGEKLVGGSKNRHYEPREVKIAQEMVWTGAACDVGEFGVNQVQLTNRALEPFKGDALHASGMVFEPVGSTSDAHQAAEQDFQKKISAAANLDRISQLFVRFVNKRFGLVYYPLWVIRYLYKGRAFQVVVDGFSGKVLYGKAPGNALYRAAMLVGGMAAGAFLAVDIPTFLLMAAGASHSSKGSGTIVGIAIGALVVGIGLIGFAYRAFRYGEIYEYGGANKLDIKQLTSGYGDLGKMVMGGTDSNNKSGLR